MNGALGQSVASYSHRIGHELLQTAPSALLGQMLGGLVMALGAPTVWTSTRNKSSQHGSMGLRGVFIKTPSVSGGARL